MKSKPERESHNQRQPTQCKVPLLPALQKPRVAFMALGVQKTTQLREEYFSVLAINVCNRQISSAETSLQVWIPTPFLHEPSSWKTLCLLGKLQVSTTQRLKRWEEFLDSKFFCSNTLASGNIPAQTSCSIEFLAKSYCLAADLSLWVMGRNCPNSVSKNCNSLAFICSLTKRRWKRNQLTRYNEYKGNLVIVLLIIYIILRKPLKLLLLHSQNLSFQ